MVANIDHNLGLLRKKLDLLELAENTILIFTTDNGTAAGAKFAGLDSVPTEGFNSGMRGKKSSVYEGGHRVPFLIHWPAGGLVGGKDLNSLTAHLDVLPTLAELSKVPIPKSITLDGISFADQLKDQSAPPHRDHLVVQFQGGPHFRDEAKPWEYTCILSENWRLMDGKELYDIKNDPAQSKDVSEKHPDVVAKLRAFYDPFWKSVSPRMTPVAIDLGNPDDNPTVLCSQDWRLPTGNPPWNFGSIRKLPRVTGPWIVDVKQAGRYRLTLRQFPKEANMSVVADKAKVEIAGIVAEKNVSKGDKGVIFEMDLPAGKTELNTWLYDAKSQAGGAYFTEVEKLEP